MDLELIFPPISLDERYARSVGDVGGHLPPMGLASIAAFLIENGYSVDILDCPADDISVDGTVKHISKNDPSVIGISSLTSTFNRANALGEELKKAFPEKLIIIGGHHATILPEKIMQENSCFDLLVFGEGELTILEVLNKFKDKNLNRDEFLRDVELLKSIKGIVLRDNGKIVKNPPREPIEDLNALPFPARHLLPMEKYLPLPNQYLRPPVAHMVAIRGCPFNCSFCSNSAVFGRKIRARSPEKVIEEIKHVMEKYGVREISFWDDSLTVNKKWLTKLCDLMIEEKLDIVWSSYARADAVDRELLQKMADAGCWNIFYGFESGSQELLNNINKGISIEDIRNATKWTKEAGIQVRASFMLALPGETPALAQKTIDFAIELDPDYAQFCITTPFPGTKLYDEAEKHGKMTRDFSKYNIWNPVFVPFGYEDKAQINKMEQQAMRSFYLRPTYIFKRVKNIRSYKDFIRCVKGLRLVSAFIKD